MKPRRCLVLLLTVLTAAGLDAFSVNPMSVELDPDQPNAQQLFVLSNTADTDVPVEVRVARPVVDEHGVETLEMDVGEDAFVILPQQLVLPARGRRSVKVAYVGESDGTEQTYRILFRQVPVDLAAAAENTAGDRPTFNMQVVLEYHTRVWITPKSLRAKLAVARFTRTEAALAPPRQSADGTQVFATEPTVQPVLELVIANTGGKHGYLLGPRLVAVTGDGREISLPDEMVKPLLGQVVLPGRERLFRVPLAAPLAEPADLREIRLILGNP